MDIEIPAAFAGYPVMHITGANAHPTYTHVRAGCRGIVLRGDEMLISHELNSGWYLIPGGGLEDGETLEACCLREIEEETGVIARVEKPLLCLREHYEDWLFISYYFLCSPTGQRKQALTEAEARRGLVAEWMDLQKALEIFSRHEEYAATSEEKRGSYQREYTALKCFLEGCP
ncbi:MAG: NUDIX domain-containing protein [Clostridiales bacterium]|nr:NUDIX domain-containing protein [Clostridiales bacterium]